MHDAHELADALRASIQRVNVLRLRTTKWMHAQSSGTLSGSSRSVNARLQRGTVERAGIAWVEIEGDEGMAAAGEAKRRRRRRERERSGHVRERRNVPDTSYRRVVKRERIARHKR